MDVQTRQRLNRWLVGLLAVGCLLAGWFLPEADASRELWKAGFYRVGLLLAAVWLAMPTRGRSAAWAGISPWWFVGLAATMLFVARRPQVLLPLFAALFVLAVVVPYFTGQKRR